MGEQKKDKERDTMNKKKEKLINRGRDVQQAQEREESSFMLLLSVSFHSSKTGKLAAQQLD
jgi:hypothetical protein